MFLSSLIHYVSLEITEEMMVVIRRALNPNASKGEILNECNRIQIKRSDILTLDGNSWLNDEVYLAFSYKFTLVNYFKSMYEYIFKFSLIKMWK